MIRRLTALAAALALSACAGTVEVPVGGPAAVPADRWSEAPASVRTVGLGIPGGAMLAKGVRFRGGLELVVDAGSPLHSLSDLKIAGDWFYAVSDAGDLVRFRPTFDAATEEPVGMVRLGVRRLTLPDGAPITAKEDGDAEGLAVTAHGDVVVSFERDHRIWDYGPVRQPGAPRALPRPDFDFGLNDGMEAISVADGRLCGEADAPCLRVAGESGGVWDCGADGCRVVSPPPAIPIPDSEYRITGMDRDPDGDGFWVVERRFRPPADVRGRVRRMAANGSLGPVLVELSLPSTVDNFEGIAVERRRDGVRLYILSDDNNNSFQRTLLLAFDVAERFD